MFSTKVIARSSTPSFAPSNTRFFGRKFSTGNFTCLVVAEHNNKSIQAGTLSAITAASKKLGASNVAVLLAGNFKGNNSLAQHLSKLEGVNKVFVADKDSYENTLPENISILVKNLQNHLKATHVLTSATTFGKDFIPRVGGMLEVSPITDVVSIQSADTFVRPIYAGNALATVKSKDAIKLITVRGTSFEKAKEAGKSAEIVPVPADLLASASTSSTWIKDEVKQSSRPDLQTARVVISGGRGMKSGENFKILEALADQLGGAVGASRAAVDAGFVSNDLQIGQTGKIIAPELYVGVGVSGAIQHLAGMKDSKVIVCINKDPEAPLVSVSDFSLIGDLFDVVPKLTEALKKSK